MSEGSTNFECFLLFQPQAQGLACNMKLLLGVSVQCLPGWLLRFTNKQIIWNRCNWHLILGCQCLKRRRSFCSSLTSQWRDGGGRIIIIISSSSSSSIIIIMIIPFLTEPNTLLCTKFNDVQIFSI